MTASTDCTIHSGLPCATRGYNLRGLQPARLCPECGSMVSDSFGDQALEWLDAHWVRRLRGGSALMLAGQVPLIISLTRERGDWADQVWISSALFLCGAGAWLVSGHARGLDRHPGYRQLRLGVRLTCAAPLAAAVVYPIATPFLWAPCIFFTFKTLAVLASRRGARSWAKYGGFVAWNLSGSMFLLSLVVGTVVSTRGGGAVAAGACFLVLVVLVGPWMLAAYAGALAVLIRFAIGLRRE